MKDYYETLKEVLLNKILFIGEEIPTNLRTDLVKCVFIGTPQSIIAEFKKKMEE